MDRLGGHQYKDSVTKDLMGKIRQKLKNIFTRLKGILFNYIKRQVINTFLSLLQAVSINCWDIQQGHCYRTETLALYCIGHWRKWMLALGMGIQSEVHQVWYPFGNKHIFSIAQPTRVFTWRSGRMGQRHGGQRRVVIQYMGNGDMAKKSKRGKGGKAINFNLNTNYTHTLQCGNKLKLF